MPSAALYVVVFTVFTRIRVLPEGPFLLDSQMEKRPFFRAVAK
jgi:hypothetical protein